MDVVLEILKYTLPAIVVFLTAYLVIRNFLKNEEQRRKVELALANQKELLPLRLQAYERIALFLERISPESIVMRISKPGMNSRQLHAELISAIRSEYEHNLSQQVYISSQVWELVRNARGNVVKLINSASGEIKENASAMTLSKKILELAMEHKSAPTETALQALKQEIRQLF